MQYPALYINVLLYSLFLHPSLVTYRICISVYYLKCYHYVPGSETAVETPSFHRAGNLFLRVDDPPEDGKSTNGDKGSKGDKSRKGPTKKCGTKGSKGGDCPKPPPPTPDDKRDGIILSGASEEGTILQCSPNTLLIAGTQVDSLSEGMIIFSIPYSEEICDSCGTIIRKAVSIQPPDAMGQFSCTDDQTCVKVNTVLATFQDILSAELIDAFNLRGNEEQEVELLSGCGYSSSRRLSSSIALTTKGGSRSLQTAGTCNSLLAVNADGRCTYTNCYIGTNDPDLADCFECGLGCNNGCGSGWNEPLVPDRGTIWDFREPCCFHDFCYSTNTWDQDECDKLFYKKLLESCAEGSVAWQVVQFLIDSLPPTLNCRTRASIYYIAVAAVGKSAYKEAQDKQRQHEASPECAATCPTTQESGGQGTTILTVDLLSSSGTFEVYYQMYTIKDALEIKYEGNTIFSTGGVVSGSATTSVTLPAGGSSTLVEVTIDAPEAGTAWDVSVSCALPDPAL